MEHCNFYRTVSRNAYREGKNCIVKTELVLFADNRFFRTVKVYYINLLCCVRVLTEAIPLTHVHNIIFINKSVIMKVLLHHHGLQILTF